MNDFVREHSAGHIANYDQMKAAVIDDIRESKIALVITDVPGSHGPRKVHVGFVGDTTFGELAEFGINAAVASMEAVVKATGCPPIAIWIAFCEHAAATRALGADES